MVKDEVEKSQPFNAHKARENYWALHCVFSPCYLVIYLLASNTSSAKILVNEFLYICFNFSRIFISKALRITFLISFDATQHLVKLNQFIN